MDNTAEYERIFNMTIEERRKLLKEKDQEFKNCLLYTSPSPRD